MDAPIGNRRLVRAHLQLGQHFLQLRPLPIDAVVKNVLLDFRLQLVEGLHQGLELFDGRHLHLEVFERPVNVVFLVEIKQDDAKTLAAV